MNKEEIRIGNLIAFDDGSTDIVIVKGIYYGQDLWFIDWILHSGNGGFKNGDSIFIDFKPIPITEDWLLNFGFKKNYDWAKQLSAEYKYGGHGVTFYNGVYSFWCGDKFSIQIIHVHQLQNIYFALTGEELTIKSQIHSQTS